MGKGDLFSFCQNSPCFFKVQLLHKLSIRGVNGSEKLLKVIKVGVLAYSSEPREC